jgi:phosphoribosylaminoimidazole carboxylase (NCAIR synthetase)
MKSIVLLGGGTEQVDAIKISKELGYNTTVLDSNPLAIGRKFSDKFIQCDIKNSTEVFRNIKNLNVNGLMVHAIELSNVVAEVSEKLGFPSIPREVATNATNKLKRLEILKKNHIL